MGTFLIIIVSLSVFTLFILFVEDVLVHIEQQKAITKKIQEIDPNKLTMVDLLAYKKILSKAEED